MTVGELIEKLQGLDKDLVVALVEHDGDGESYDAEARSVDYVHGGYSFDLLGGGFSRDPHIRLR